MAVDHPALAYVSLGSVWTEWISTYVPNPLPSLTCPSMFAWGTADVHADVTGLWSTIPQPKHQVRFEDGGHWDYIDSTNSSCEVDIGPCPLVEGLAADLTAMFISKHAPPEASSMSSTTIPDDLSVPPVVLTGDQVFYAGAHLTSFAQIATTAGCSVVIEWDTPGGSGSRTLP